MSEPICYVMVGLPGLGKSTIVKGMYKDADTLFTALMTFLNVIANLGQDL